jgi:hypothetical protein
MFLRVVSLCFALLMSNAIFACVSADICFLCFVVFFCSNFLLAIFLLLWLVVFVLFSLFSAVLVVFCSSPLSRPVLGWCLLVLSSRSSWLPFLSAVAFALPTFLGFVVFWCGNDVRSVVSFCCFLCLSFLLSRVLLFCCSCYSLVLPLSLLFALLLPFSSHPVVSSLQPWSLWRSSRRPLLHRWSAHLSGLFASSS